MALPYLPNQGEILICNFDDSAVGSEMIKRRPVIVFSKHDRHRFRMCTVVPLSTTPPDPVRSWHYEMPHVKITGWEPKGTIWAKCDMLSSVSLDRLDKPYIKTRSGRHYVTHKLSEQDMGAILACVRAYLAI